MTTATEAQAKWRANVPDLDQRLEAERLWQAGEDAWEALREAADEHGIDDATSDDEIAAAGDEKITALKAAWDAADTAWRVFEGYADPMSESDDSTVAIRCVLTGLLVHDSDDVLVDSNTGEHLLKIALGIPVNEWGEFDLPAAAASEAA